MTRLPSLRLRCRLPGMVYIAGRTYSKTLPIHKSAYQPSHLHVSHPDAFVARISKDLDIDDDSFAATYIGGTAREDLFGLM